MCWHCLPRGGSFWETSKRMLKEVGGRYTSKPGRGQVGCYTAIKEKKKKTKKTKDYNGRKNGRKKSDGESNIFSALLFKNIS